MRYEESSVLELKEQINADFKKEIIAFANTDGGEIFVGVARDGSITGVENAEAEMERIGNMIRDGIKPDLTAYTAIEKVIEGDKALIHVTVSRGLRRPYHLIDKGLKPSGVFVRHGVSSVPATDEAIREMIRDSDGTAFDKMLHRRWAEGKLNSWHSADEVFRWWMEDRNVTGQLDLFGGEVGLPT